VDGWVGMSGGVSVCVYVCVCWGGACEV